MTKWNELKVKFSLLSKEEKLVILFCCSFVVSLIPAGFIAAVFAGEWDAGFFRKLVLSITTGYGIISTLIFAAAITFAPGFRLRQWRESYGLPAMCQIERFSQPDETNSQMHDETYHQRGIPSDCCHVASDRQ